MAAVALASVGRHRQRRVHAVDPVQQRVTPLYGTANSVPLVAYKTLVARVYPSVRPGRLGGDHLTGQKVTGDITLSVGDRVLHQVGLTVPGGGPHRSDE